MTRAPELVLLSARLRDARFEALPLHVRVHRLLRELILDGTLASGDKLPASRALAGSLELSRDTIENAYSQLEVEGFLERRAGSGSYISARAESVRSEPRTRPISLRAARLSGGLTISERGRNALRTGGVHDQIELQAFAAGIPETRGFPLTSWERMHRQVLREYGTSALLHGDPRGAPELREAIASYLNQERGTHANPDYVMVLTSSQQALGLCAHVLADHGDNIFIEDPAYHGARRAFESSGLRTIPIAVDAEGMQVGHLSNHSSDARIVYLTPSHQYPTGATLSLDRRLAAIAWAERVNGWILEDDYDSEFHYSSRPVASMQGLDSNNRTIYIGTFSKSLFPSIRIGYMVLPAELVEPMVVARTLLDGHTNRIVQLTLARFIDAGHFGAHVKTMRRVYRGRLEALQEGLKKNLAGMVHMYVPNGGLQMPCLLDEDVDESSTIALAARAGIDLPGLSRLYHTPPPRGGWLMGFAAFTPDEIKTASQRLAKALVS